MIIMKRIVFSLSVEWTPYQGRYFYPVFTIWSNGRTGIRQLYQEILLLPRFRTMLSAWSAQHKVVIRGQVGQEPGRGARAVQMPKPPKNGPSSVNISHTTSAQHIPPRKAHRRFPIPWASCAIFRNATILLNPSIAREILKSQRSNAPSVASCG